VLVSLAALASLEVPKKAISLAALAALFSGVQAGLLPVATQASSADITADIIQAVATTTLIAAVALSTSTPTAAGSPVKTGSANDDDLRAIFRHKGIAMLIFLYESTVAVVLISACYIVCQYCVDELTTRDCHKEGCVEKDCERKKCIEAGCRKRHCAQKQRRLLSAMCTAALLGLFGWGYLDIFEMSQMLATDS
jgi:hypothetical protein